MSRKRVKDMQKKDEYCITAGEFAKMCQTTRDTLRYYERQGILVPKKNPGSTDIIIIVMHRSVPIILSEHSVNWTVRWEILKNTCWAGKR